MRLHEDLVSGTYRHGTYSSFRIADPKPRIIHKACVRDRLLHHAVHRKLYPFFNRLFIADSFACRKGRGLHRAMNRFRRFAWKASKNHTRSCWVLTCDIRKYFASIDHRILIGLLCRWIPERRLRSLLYNIIFSFQTSLGKGIPLGNLTSQLFSNIYLNELDQYIKHKLRYPYYIRYADDFVILDPSRERLYALVPQIRRFIDKKLCLRMHADKIEVRTVASGTDFLGWVHFSHHRVLRTATKHRMLLRIRRHPIEASLQSYLGMLSHGNAQKLSELVRNEQWLWSDV